MLDFATKAEALRRQMNPAKYKEEARAYLCKGVLHDNAQVNMHNLHGAHLCTDGNHSLDMGTERHVIFFNMGLILHYNIVFF